MTQPPARKRPDSGGAGTRNIVVVGAGGQLGTALRGRVDAGVESVGGDGCDVRFLTRADLDIADRGAVEADDRLRDADVVINAAAWTDVDGAETPDGEAAAHAINADGAANLARACAATGAFLVHVSTDYVFGDQTGDQSGDGLGRDAPAGRRALAPDAPTAPDTAYGRTKLAGERAVLGEVEANGLRAAIVRTAWVYSGPTQPDVGDFVSTMLRLEERGRTGEGPAAIDVVDDQHGNPTFVDDLATAIGQLAARPVPGIFHVTGSGAATWHELATEVFVAVAKQRDGDAADLDAARARVRPCTSEQFPRPAKRPAWSVLDGGTWAQAGFAPLPDWRDGLRRALAQK
ncbi:dTDP-4-dehydrorhamnose reductase [uncultured Corynebacterium sp.]|uniref:dTDP-4-dehydrorhamnose reductase n=1 Tax=uncultured Corynebacterium sp. TaxID=159447 RepID=UPI0025D09AFD|nr:dTDP-4-dehydrorhamnose reductase [uncultured Corynebacterium sp.]